MCLIFCVKVSNCSLAHMHVHSQITHTAYITHTQAYRGSHVPHHLRHILEGEEAVAVSVPLLVQPRQHFREHNLAACVLIA